MFCTSRAPPSPSPPCLKRRDMPLMSPGLTRVWGKAKDACPRAMRWWWGKGGGGLPPQGRAGARGESRDWLPDLMESWWGSPGTCHPVGLVLPGPAPWHWPPWVLGRRHVSIPSLRGGFWSWPGFRAKLREALWPPQVPSLLYPFSTWPWPWLCWTVSPLAGGRAERQPATSLT